MQIYSGNLALEHPDDLKQFTSLKHKLDNSAATYGIHLVANPQFRGKCLYHKNKFIYIICRPNICLGLITKTIKYTPYNAYLYYTFRLRRLCEMAKMTKGAVFLTWDELVAGKGFDLLTSYLNLKPAVEPMPLETPVIRKYPYDLLQKADESYERHLYYLRHQDLLMVNH